MEYKDYRPSEDQTRRRREALAVCFSRLSHLRVLKVSEEDVPSAVDATSKKVLGNIEALELNFVAPMDGGVRLKRLVDVVALCPRLKKLTIDTMGLVNSATVATGPEIFSSAFGVLRLEEFQCRDLLIFQSIASSYGFHWESIRLLDVSERHLFLHRWLGEICRRCPQLTDLRLEQKEARNDRNLTRGLFFFLASLKL